jgi:hypothetical protein
MRHGGPYDRGSADSYYRRSFSPHYFMGASYSTARIEINSDVETAELAAYTAGYDDNESDGNYKYD